jgi:hypothetical protein
MREIKMPRKNKRSVASEPQRIARARSIWKAPELAPNPSTLQKAMRQIRNTEKEDDDIRRS